jgi:hypothetical protein
MPLDFMARDYGWAGSLLVKVFDNSFPRISGRSSLVNRVSWVSFGRVVGSE